MDLARAPRRRPLTARKKGSGYENGLGLGWNLDYGVWTEVSTKSRNVGHWEIRNAGTEEPGTALMSFLEFHVEWLQNQSRSTRLIQNTCKAFIQSYGSEVMMYISRQNYSLQFHIYNLLQSTLLFLTFYFQH